MKTEIDFAGIKMKNPVTVASGTFGYGREMSEYIDLNKLMRADSSVLKIQGNVITPEYKIINMIRQTQIPNIQIF